MTEKIPSRSFWVQFRPLNSEKIKSVDALEETLLARAKFVEENHKEKYKPLATLLKEFARAVKESAKFTRERRYIPAHLFGYKQQIITQKDIINLLIFKINLAVYILLIKIYRDFDVADMQFVIDNTCRRSAPKTKDDVIYLPTPSSQINKVAELIYEMHNNKKDSINDKLKDAVKQILFRSSLNVHTIDNLGENFLNSLVQEALSHRPVF